MDSSKICFLPVSFLCILLSGLRFANPVQSSGVQNQTNAPVVQVTKQLSFPDFGSDISKGRDDVKLLGSAVLANEKRCVQIPGASQKFDLRHLAGRVIYSSPVRLFDPLSGTPASFQTTFSFQFETTARPSNSSNKTAGGGGSFISSDGGHGLAFIFSPDEFTVGRPGPWLGMLNDACDEDYKAVGIEFDTRLNPQFGDPNDNHVGINLGSIVSSAVIDASTVGVYLKDGSIHRAWINYDGRHRIMDIRLSPDSKNYPSKPVYSGHVDLSPYLKEYMFVGFSASTGNHTQIHNIFSWNFSSTSEALLRLPLDETCDGKIIVGNSQQKKSTHHKKTPISFYIFIAVVVLILLVVLNLCNQRRRREHGETVVLPEKKQRPRPPNKPRRFTIAEISSATRCFSEPQMLGSDDRGVTYRGTMPNGSSVAVKRFTAQFFNSYGLDRRRMAKEIKAVSRVRHPNLVPIRGWCFDRQESMVVYDYLPNGSLDKWLFGVGVLPWTRRLKVVKDIAEALSYMHNHELAHKNVKTNSVFLDLSFRAMLGDFGFVLCSSDSKRFESMVSQTADVFEFGVFVLEVVAGRTRQMDMEGRRSDLLQLAWATHEKDEKETAVDKRMGSLVNREQAVRVIEIGLLCTLKENKGRPNMEDVVEMLSSERPLPELPPSRPISLFPYSSTTGLCSGYACASFK